MTKRPRDPENPPLTAAELARLKPFPGDLPPAQAAALAQAHATRRRGTQRTPTKVAISLRVTRATLAAYRATGRGWQGRMNADLERAAKRLPAGTKRSRVS